MRAGRRPPHLLLLDEPLADDLVDGGLDKPSGDWLAVSVSIRIVRADYRNVLIGAVSWNHGSLFNGLCAAATRSFGHSEFQ
jgi:hypothetical protein